MENRENRKSFGAFICQRRKELNMTQKEFAQKLFVTDSAVSKWERGLAYPDITLLQSICQVLQISEKELLSASEDTEGRRAETLAKRYLRLLRNYRIFWYILYGLIALGCGIGNIMAQHSLSWFWIVIGTEAMAASLTLLPAMVPVGKRRLYSLAGFTVSWLFQLLACCIYSGGTWFFTAAASVLLGMGIVFGGFVLNVLPLPETLKNQKFSLYLAAVLGLLYLQLGVICISTGGNWYWMAFVSSLFAVWLLFGPLVLRKLPLEGIWKNRRTLLYFVAGLLLWLALYGVYYIQNGKNGFVSAAVWTVFGVSLVILPYLLFKNQIPLKPHRALAYLGFETILLFVGVIWEGATTADILTTLLSVLLPWGWLGTLRYLPVGKWVRAGMGFWWTGLWCWLYPWFMDRIYIYYLGWESNNLYSLRIRADFSNWQDWATRGNNIHLLILLVLGLLGLGAVAMGIWRDHKAI